MLDCCASKLAGKNRHRKWKQSCCKERTGFIGSDAVRAAREAGTAEKLVAFKIDGPGIARQGNPVVGGGVVTSGTQSPTLNEAIGANIRDYLIKPINPRQVLTVVRRILDLKCRVGVAARSKGD